MIGPRQAPSVLAALAAVTLLPPAVLGQRIWHVDVKASGPAHDGTTWCQAFRTVQDALNAAASGDIIRVGPGTYKPDRTGLANGRDATFRLVDGVSLDGGFAGCGAIHPDARDFVAYETILSGDLNGDDGPNFANRTDNCYHVVLGYRVGAATILDGFTVRGGQANGPNFGPTVDSRDQGSAVNVHESTPQLLNCTFVDNFSSNHAAVNDHGGTTLINCTFRGNHAGVLGGGFYPHLGVSATVIGCRFYDNTCDGLGGGVYSKGISDSRFKDCLFRGNRAFNGGGLYCDNASDATIQNCVFLENSAISQGGGVYNNGSNPTFMTCTFTGNTAGTYAGAMRNLSSHPVVTGCVFVNNSSGGTGGAIHDRLSSPTINRCAFFSNTANSEGGAIFNIEGSSPIVRNSLFAGNLAQPFGGAIQNRDLSFPKLQNCTLYANSAVPSDGINNDNLSGTSLTNSIVWNHTGGAFGGAGTTTATYSDIEGGYVGEGNRNAAPLFVDADGPDNTVGTEDDDLRLRRGSPGINVGDPAFVATSDEEDLAGGPRVVGCRVDMGAHESSTLQTPGDFNADQAVNLADFAKFELCVFNPPQDAEWWDTCLCVFDFDGSKFVDLADYAMFPWDLGLCDIGDHSCDDGEPCNGVEACIAGVCQPGTPVDCDDGDLCTDDVCEAGVCGHVDNTLPCDDDDACTSDDRCADGACVGGPAPSCEDGNPCTDDVCDALVGCVTTPNGNSCDDGDACTTGDTCSGGVCSGGEPLDCDDHNQCTTETCDALLGCVVTLTSASCDDGDACTSDDRCADGACVGGPAPSCEDGNPCTDDACDALVGCVTAPNGNSCDDDDACTVNDRCGEGLCAGGATLDCEDGNVCTTDSCDAATGCFHEANVEPCDDGNACTSDDRCTGGACVVGPAPSCEDGNPCTDDACDAALGCIHSENTGPCDDGDLCTLDQCVGTVCIGSLVICPADTSCDPADGVCKECLSGADCNDGDLCTVDACNLATGTCSHDPTDCDDGLACTTDTCDPTSGCLQEAVVCLNGQHCDPSTGECVPDAPLGCAIDDDCSLGQICAFDMICRVPCIGDHDCSSGQACFVSALSDGVCAIPCVDGSDCPTGQICDGFCFAE